MGEGKSVELILVSIAKNVDTRFVMFITFSRLFCQNCNRNAQEYRQLEESRTGYWCTGFEVTADVDGRRHEHEGKLKKDTLLNISTLTHRLTSHEALKPRTQLSKSYIVFARDIDEFCFCLRQASIDWLLTR